MLLYTSVVKCLILILISMPMYPMRAKFDSTGHMVPAQRFRTLVTYVHPHNTVLGGRAECEYDMYTIPALHG